MLFIKNVRCLCGFITNEYVKVFITIYLLVSYRFGMTIELIEHVNHIPII